jgi:hypothetical protein
MAMALCIIVTVQGCICHTCENVKHGGYILSSFHTFPCDSTHFTVVLCCEKLKGIAGRNSWNATSSCNTTVVELVRCAVL